MKAISRTRGLLLVLSLGALLGGAWFAGRFAIDDWWPWVAGATVLSILLTEPRYTNPVAALVNAVAALAAFASADRTSLAGLWWTFAGFSALVFMLAMVAIALRDERRGAWARKLVSVVGSAKGLGFTALAIEAFASASTGSQSWSLAGGIAIALVLTSPTVADVLAIHQNPQQDKARFAIVGSESPNLLTVISPLELENGTSLKIVVSEKTYDAIVVSGHADENGALLVLATNPPLALNGLKDVRILEFEMNQGRPSSLGVVIQGTTPEQLVLRPSGVLETSQLIGRSDENNQVLYQVTHTELVRVVEGSRHSTEQRAWAAQIGRIRDRGEIEFEPELPTPFESIHAVPALVGKLPDGFVRIGDLAGTKFPIGFNAKDPATGHLAILGMSGMGKTTAARRLADALGASNVVGIVDVGGEYVGRLGLKESSTAAFVGAGGPGVGAVGMTGSIVKSFRLLSEQTFAQAKSEYAAGAVVNRVLFAEEAHSLVPEWNSVVERYDSQEVAATCAVVLQARKFGLRFVFVSQRTANVSKSAISQCANYIVFRMVDETGLEYLSSVAGSGYVQVVRTLKPHQALVVGPAFSTSTPVIVDTLNWSPVYTAAPTRELESSLEFQ